MCALDPVLDIILGLVCQSLQRKNVNVNQSCSSFRNSALDKIGCRNPDNATTILLIVRKIEIKMLCQSCIRDRDIQIQISNPSDCMMDRCQCVDIAQTDPLNPHLISFRV